MTGFGLPVPYMQQHAFGDAPLPVDRCRLQPGIRELSARRWAEQDSRKNTSPTIRQFWALIKHAAL
jgi:hypothetical protein